jgi:hypothetical protein
MLTIRVGIANTPDRRQVDDAVPLTSGASKRTAMLRRYALDNQPRFCYQPPQFAVEAAAEAVGYKL